MWVPQAVHLILDMKRIQRRATKFILIKLYRIVAKFSYKQRFLITRLLPLCFWHDFLYLEYVLKCLVILTDPFILVMNPIRPRRIDSSKGTLLNTVRTNTVTFRNSFYYNALRIWDTLPSHVLNIDVSVSHFKKELFNFYLCLSNTVYDVNTLRPIRLCVSSATLVGH